MPADDDEDPLERARAAIRAAREARGLDPDAEEEAEEALPDDPMERARVILERAAAARESKGRRADEREQRAREQLARLKGQAPPDDEGGDEPVQDKPAGPRPRRL